MCFSATASFSMGLVLSATGIVTLKKCSKRSQFAFAAIPLIFGIQQISEGFVWISLQNAAYAHWNIAATYFFLVFAQVLWPAWVPLSMLMLEKEKHPRRMLYALTALGLLVACYLCIRIVTHTISSQIVEMHISYDMGAEAKISGMMSVLYFIAIVTPAFFSGIHRMWLLGILILASYLVTLVFYEEYVISVWCFFAALISVAIYFLIPRPEKATAGSYGLS